ncbi:MAG: helix-turn-helix domain-containing protein [Acidimicrobiales bacterium]
MSDRGDTVDWSAMPLGALIRKARAEAGATQADLGNQIGKTGDLVRAIEAGTRSPSLDTLVQMATVLVADRDQRVRSLARWLVKLQERQVATAAVDPSHAAVLSDAAARVSSALEPARRRLPPPFPRSLEGFPEQFQPLVAVFPDRREVPPDSAADLFALSGAVGDYRFIGHLSGLETPLTIVSDKLFVLRPRDWLARRFSDAHLLIVGSNAVNWLTRTSSALFRPQIEPEARAWTERYLRRAPDLEDPKLLKVFWHVVETTKRTPHHEVDGDLVPRQNLATQEVALLPEAVRLATDLLDGRTEQEIKQLFQVASFADPAHGEQHRPHGAWNDLGVVSLAPHPFDTTGRFVSILCAGIAGPGTALGLRALLTEQGEFAERPFGGVIDVQLPPGQKTWPGRYEDAYWHWRTLPYKPPDVLANLAQAAATADSRRRTPFRGWLDAELASSVAFVEQLMAGTSRPAP